MLKPRAWGWVLLAGWACGACAQAATFDGPEMPPQREPTTPAAAEEPREVLLQEPQPATRTPPPRQRPSSELAELLRFLDERKSTTQPRAQNLIATELRGLEKLLELTLAQSPDRPQLARRLAESYAELRSAAERDQARLSGADAAEARSVADTAASRAIALFEQFLHDYPAYSKRDDVLFSLAIEYGWSADPRQVREKLFLVIKDHPTSVHVPLTYFVFGELFAFEAATQPDKSQLAIAAFKEASRYPPPQNRAYCLSLERIAELGVGRGAGMPTSFDEKAACARVQPVTP